jgi:D-xylose transport system substrate-binding protein
MSMKTFLTRQFTNGTKLICAGAFGLAAASMPVAKAAEVKVGFILSTMQEERYQKDKKYFQAAAKKLGMEVVFASADNQERTQSQKVENILAKGVKALVIQPVNSDAAGALVDMAKKAGVPVIAYDRIIKNADLDYYVTQDSCQVGRLQAEAAAKALSGKGNVVILSGQAGHSVAEEITRCNLDVFKKFPGIKVVLQQTHNNWSTALAMATTENALSKNKNNIQAILANNSGMASGAVQSVGAQKLTGKIFIAGADADVPSIRNIVAGKQSFEVFKAIQPLAEKAAEVAFRAAKGEKLTSDFKVNNGSKDVISFNTPVFAVDKTNFEDVVINSGFHTREAIYGNTAAR